MPEVEVEITRTTTINREETAAVVLDVPKRVLDGEELLEWVDEAMSDGDSEVAKAIDGAAWEMTDEDESHEYEYIEANALS